VESGRGGLSAPPETTLIAFDGAVECGSGTGSITLILRGRERAADAAALFAGARSEAGLPTQPSQLHAVRLWQRLPMVSPRRVQLSSSESPLQLICYSLQIHRDVSRAFFGAVPPLRVGLPRRLAWALLLSLLRLPGVARLIGRLRSDA
jgi:hypothetical protein